MPTIHVDGKVTTVPEGFTIDDLLPDRDRNLSIGVIRPVTISQAETKEFLFKTTAGEVVVETIPNSHAGEILSGLYTMRSGWQDLRVATFGPLSLSFIPSRKPSRYERGDLVIGCGGYDPNRSYLIFCRRTHTADHGGPAEHSVIGTVVSGLGVLDRFRENDVIMSVEPVISFAESSDAHTTTDGSLMLEEGMHIITHIAIQAEGKNTDG